ncbi:MAG: hypothetical protein GQF41_3677 [Candidatus Rifleibacterium amylolyticum]|nr:MAG: hypothetical protein GQF41_3677 [Candidatus Rifleibacterium amylolyticum]
MRLRHQAAIVCAVIIAMLSIIKNLPVMPLFHQIESGEIPHHESALLPLKGLLPKDRVIEYVSDLPEDEVKEAYYQITQYTLAPLLIDNSFEYATIIGYFSNKDSLNEFCQKYQAKVLQESTEGIYLLERSL